MGLFRKRADVPSAEAWQTDPQAALRLARDAIAAGGTYVDQNGNRRRVTPAQRERMLGSLDAAAWAAADLPIWPSGSARFDGGILEITAGDGFRVAAADVLEIGTEPLRAGRLSLTVSYRAGLDDARRSYCVEARHEAALRALVESVSAAIA